MKSGGRSSVLSVHLLPVAIFVHRAEPTMTCVTHHDNFWVRRWLLCLGLALVLLELLGPLLAAYLWRNT